MGSVCVIFITVGQPSTDTERRAGLSAIAEPEPIVHPGFRDGRRATK